MFSTGPSAEPASVTAVALSSESIYLSWDPPLFSEQNGQIQHYIINITELDTGNNFIQLAIATNTEFTFYSLHPHYTYAFTIAAVTVDVGPTSNSVTVMTEEDGKRVIINDMYVC